jgi:membrane protease YdiL (CAAX protease family)
MAELFFVSMSFADSSRSGDHMTRSRENTSVILAGLAIALGIPALPLSRWENEFAGVKHLLGYELIWWALIAAVLLYVGLVERRPQTSIGFRAPHGRDIIIAIGAGIVILAGTAGIYYGLFPALHISEGSQMNRLIATPFWWRLISVIRAAVGEEVLFRGYSMERIRELTGSMRIASILSCTIFTLEHIGTWGVSHLLIAGFGGVALTALYLWRRNLWVNIIAHFIVDGAAVLLA